MWKQEEAEGGEGARERERWVEDRHSPSKSGPTLPDEVAFVGKDVDFKGVITYSGTVRIDGSLDGEIHTDGGLLVGPEAVLKAKVSAGTVVCQGTIHGDIQAKDQIVLRAPAVVHGSLTTPVLFDGRRSGVQWDVGDEATGKGRGRKGHGGKRRQSHEPATGSTTSGVMSVQSL